MPRPASATSTTRSGWTASASATASPSAATGERTRRPPPPAPRPGRRPGQLGHQVGDLPGRAAEGLGGHGGRHRHGYQRCMGQTWPTGSPVAWARTSASVGRVVARPVGLHRLAGGDDQPPPPQGLGQPAATQVLPTSVPVPGPPAPAAPGRCGSRPIPPPGRPRRRLRASRTSTGRRCGRPRRSPAGGRCRRAPSAGGWPAPASPGRAARQRRPRAASSSPSTTATMGLGGRATRPVDVAAQARHERRVALGRAHDPQGSRRCRDVGRRGAVGEDEQRAPVAAAGPRSAGAQPRSRRAAQRLGQRAHPQHGSPASAAPRFGLGTEDRVGLVEHEQRSWAAHTSIRPVHAGTTSPSMEKALSVTTSRAGRRLGVDQKLGEVVEVGVAVDDHGPGEASSHRRSRRGSARPTGSSRPHPPSVANRPMLAGNPVGTAEASRCPSSRPGRPRARRAVAGTRPRRRTGARAPALDGL